MLRRRSWSRLALFLLAVLVASYAVLGELRKAIRKIEGDTPNPWWPR